MGQSASAVSRSVEPGCGSSRWRSSWLALLGMSFVAPPLAAAPVPSVPDAWLTVAERSEFRATSSYEETMDYLRRLDEASSEIRVETFGRSAQGRPLPLVILSAEGAFTPEAAARLAKEKGKPIVLVQNGIHPGEIDGKDASLMLLRDVVLGRRPELLEAATLLVIPIYNADGHERVSPWNRPNQDGPVEGMGFRTTTSGLDLNRDHLKAVSPEARAVLALFDRWQPHLHVDDHVTDGSDHDWVLTWSWAEPPQIDPAIGAWLAERMPKVLAATAAKGHLAGPYIDLLDRSDPAKGFSSSVGEPRYATGYYPLRHRPSILVEMHSYKPYRERVLANRDFLAELIAETGRSGRGLIAAIAAAEAATVAAGRPDAPPSTAVLSWAEAPAPDRIVVPFREWSVEPSVALGVPILVFGEATRPTEVDWHHRPVPETTVPRPRGYLVEAGWPEIEARLVAHGLRVERLVRPVDATVETLHVSAPAFAESSYQGLVGVEAEVERRPARMRVPAGTLWVPADQPGFDVAIHLFEPDAPDSLFAWGLLSSVTEQKEYIEPRVLDPIVREMLASDEALASEWAAALEEEAFASDWQARWIWWHRRTPYWDSTVGRLPVVRVMARPAKLATEPWVPGMAVAATRPAPPVTAVPLDEPGLEPAAPPGS